MGNFLFAYGHITPLSLSATNTNSSYPAANLSDVAHWLRRWQGNNTSSVITYDMGSAQSVKAWVLYDCNFTTATLTSADDAGFTINSTSLSLIPKLDERTGRYKICVDTRLWTARRHWKITIPVQTYTDGLSVPRCGSIMAAGSVIEFSANPDYPYECEISEPVDLLEFESGGHETITRGTVARWQGTFGNEALSAADAAHWFSIASVLRRGTLLALFENLGDAGKVYLCTRKSDIKITFPTHGTVRVERITLRET